MTNLNLICFGIFQTSLNGKLLTSFHSVKVQALLAYLALESEHIHHREALATLLWPLDSEASARNSLRQALYELRKLLGDRDDLHRPFLLVTRQSVQFNPAGDYTLDVADFLEHVKNQEWEQAATLYRGELLAGLSCESEPFEEWLRLTRARFHNLAIDVCFKLTHQALTHGDFTQARTYAERQLALEPWREEAHRQLMSALALAGERSAALAQYETCRRVLADELGVEPGAETVRLYEQIRTDKLQPTATSAVQAIIASIGASPVVGSPPAASAISHPPSLKHNLPAQLTPFIGRKTDLEQITARLGDPACRLLTIVGSGGIGKTRLAIQAAQLILDLEVEPTNAKASSRVHSQSAIRNSQFTDGLFFVALAGVASPDLLVPTIAAALDFTFYGSGDPKSQLLDYLRAKSLLLVLDNFEHLLDGAELVSDLLAAASEVKVLVTSREALRLREEWLHPLTGMSFPVDGTQMATLENYSAMQLFAQCARQVQPSFDLVSAGSEVAHICRLVDGMPLAIELAATWLKFYSCAQIAQEVARNLDFLTTKLRNVSPRHRSMRAVFEHSWNLLAAEEQQVLRQLAVFRGGFTAEAATQVTGAALPLLLTLVEKSLLQWTQAQRFQFHELLRQFAEEKLLADPAEAARVQDAHCSYYCTWLGQQEAHLKGPAYLTAMLAIEHEIENVRAAWVQAVTHDHLDELERAVESLSCFHEFECWYEQGMLLFQRTAEVLAPRQTDDRHRILFARILTQQGYMQGLIAREMGRVALREPTETLLAQALAILQDYRETLAYGDALWLGNRFRPSEDHQQWAELLLTAIAIFEKHHDHWRIARALEGLGFQTNLSGRYALAIQYFERGISLCEQIGDQRTLGDILDNYGEVRRALGEYDEAMHLAQAGLAARSAVGNKRGIAFSLYLLGDLAWRIGNLEDALRYSRQSVAIFTEIGVTYGLDAALNNLGNIACTLGDLAEARRQFGLILQPKLASNALEASNLVPWALTGMAEVLRQEGRTTQAVELVEQVLRHPNNWQEYKDRATKLRNELATLLPAEVIAAAQARGQTQSLNAAVTELFAEQNPGTP